MKTFVAVGIVLLAAAGMSRAQSGGEATYKAKCQLCHGETGVADTPVGKALQAKSFLDPEVVKMADAALIGIAKNGSGKMPAFKDTLSDAEIKDVIDYIRTLEKK